MQSKKHNIVYLTTNLINGKIYIGRHVTNKLDDGYLGSGNEFGKALKEFGRENFIREVLFDFEDPKEMVDKETELIKQLFENQKETYNAILGGSGITTHSPEVRQKLREINTGIVTVRGEDGKCFKVSVNDPRYISGELKHNTYGTVCVKDSEGNKFRVPIDDPRWLSGELVGQTTGNIRPEETVEKHTEFMKEYWKTHDHGEEGLRKMRDANIGMVNVQDKDGNEFRVSCDDPRIESGELVNARKGNIWIHNIELQKSRFVRPAKVQGFLDEGWQFGLVYFNKKKRIWISNQTNQSSKQTTEDKLLEFISDGWVVGRLFKPENFGNAISESRKKNPGKWMINPETNERRIIWKSLSNEYLLKGWVFGKILPKQ